MKEKEDYIRDIAEIRSMMERSSKFMSLSGWAGIMAGVYAIGGAYIAYMLGFDPKDIFVPESEIRTGIWGIVLLGIVVILLAMTTAIYFSYTQAKKSGETLWNPSSKQLLFSMAVPLVPGGILMLLMIIQGLTGLVIPLSLVFYGVALYNASKFTYEEVRTLGVTQILLGLLSACFIEHALLLWTLGFGAGHIAYGIYMHIRYKK